MRAVELIREIERIDWLDDRTIWAAAAFLGGIGMALLFSRLGKTVLRRKLSEESKAQRTVLAASGLASVAIWVTAGAITAAWILPLRQRVFDYAVKVLLIVAVAILTVAASRIAANLVWIQHSKLRAFPSTSILAIVAKIAIYALGLMTVLKVLGISLVPLLTAVGVGGLAVALALQDTLSNLFAGLHILASRKVKPGDYVSLDSGQHGYVIDINWRNAAIRELPNNVIMVPNSLLANAIVTNFSRPANELSILMQVGVAYGSDLEFVERVTIEVAHQVMQEVPGAVPKFDPLVRFHTFGEYSIGFTVILRAREFVDQYLIKHEFVKRLHARYAQDGIEIPFPVRTLISKDPVDRLLETTSV